MVFRRGYVIVNEARMNNRQNTGKFGEDRAADYLEGRGFTILARNWRSGHYELDIVAVDDDGIHFVEVRTRINPEILPQETVNSVKQRKVVEAARRFLREEAYQKFSDFETFFDVVGVSVTGDDTDLEYIPQAFIPMYRQACRIL